MNGEAGNNCVEEAQQGNRFVHRVSDDTHGGIVGKTPANGGKHGWREIESDGFDRSFAAVKSETGFDEGEQTAIAGAEVEHAARVRRDELEQRSGE